MICHVSNQIADYAYITGIQQIEEIESEKRMMRSLRMGKKYLQILGRRHCRFGIKQRINSTAYIEGYSRQIEKENQIFEVPF